MVHAQRLVGDGEVGHRVSPALAELHRYRTVALYVVNRVVLELRGALPVCTENLNPDISVMKSAKDRA